MKDLSFLLEINVFSSQEIEALAKEVLFILRLNRKKMNLPIEQVEIGNGFILAAQRIAMFDPNMNLEIPQEDLNYIIEENALIHMGLQRN
jgi:hypothetical protein